MHLFLALLIAIPPPAFAPFCTTFKPLGIVAPECYCAAGGCPAPGVAWDEVFREMILSPECAPGRLSIYNNRETRISCTAYLSQTYRFRQRLEVPCPAIFEGVGAQRGNARGKLSFVENVSGVWVPGTGNATLPGRWIGDGLELRNISIESEGGTSTSAHGLTLAGVSRLYGVVINNFPGDGIRGETPNGGTMIGSVWHDVWINRSGHHAINVEFGSNNNSIRLYALHVNGACLQDLGPYDREKPPRCAGVRYAGNLGIDWSASNVDMASRIWPALNFMEAPTAPLSRLSGIYVEPTGIPSRVGQVEVFGNVPVDPRDSPMVIGARGIEGNVAFPSGPNLTRLGPSLPGNLLEHRVGAQAFRWIAEPTGIAMKHGGVANAAMRITGAGGPIPANKLQADQLYVGKGRSTLLSSGTKATRPDPATLPLGSFWANQAPAAGVPWAWQVCPGAVVGTKAWCSLGAVGAVDP